MEETTTTTTTVTTNAPQGKGMAIAGFVISLVALVFYVFVATAVTFAAAMGGGYGLATFWLVLCLAGVLLSVLGMMKLGKTGGKKGIAIAGLIIGIVATIFTAMLIMGIAKIQSEAGVLGNQFKEAMEQSAEQMKSEMNQAIDSVQGEH